MSHLRIEIYASGKVNECRQIALAPLEVNLTIMTRMYIITHVYFICKDWMDSDESSHTFSRVCRSVVLYALVLITARNEVGARLCFHRCV